MRHLSDRRQSCEQEQGQGEAEQLPARVALCLQRTSKDCEVESLQKSHSQIHCLGKRRSVWQAEVE